MNWPWDEFAQQLSRIEGYLYTLVHPNLIVAHLLEDSVGLLLKVWFKFILSTTDFETGGDFIYNSTIQRFEPKVQLAANAAMVLIAVWASYRIMLSQGVTTQYDARVVLPRLFMGTVLINFGMPLFQMAVAANNAICSALLSFTTHDDLATFAASYTHNPNAGTWEIITTGALAGGYGVLAIAYLVRYAVLVVLAVTAPLAALFFVLPETHHLARMWSSHFTTNLFMQPAQLFVLSVGLALEHDGFTPVHHLFALASLLIVFKVPGAIGGAEKAAHRLESTALKALGHIGRALVKA
ncbi:MAG TPA: hypothetical protein VGR23_01450 [Candidatus Dormibacteraeota bacterium]|jgi:hypothetical protein|nr:hypothetical protein [Candidatus Dormibacteraeota bacterium]